MVPRVDSFVRGIGRKKKGKEKIEKEVTFLFFSPFLPEIPVELIFTRGLA